ncbi:MAG: alpha/beta hydrolase [Elusimicrobia bacterium]|nr:alpha/beta hydrolase [Elusimicrobiota bacterium]
MPAVGASFMEVAGVRTHVRSAGEGPPVILLHGLGASSYSWRYVLPALGERFKVFAPDWPGFGRSGQPWDFDYSVDGFVRWLLAFMDALGLGRAALVGNSMGGMLSLAAAMAHPGRVSGLALLGTPVYTRNKPHLLWPIRWPLIGGVYERCIGPWAVAFIGRTAFVDPSLITPELLEEYGMALRTAAGRRAIAQFLRNAIPPDAEDRIRRYPQVETPTLVIVGKHDPVVDVASAERFAKTLRNGRLLVLPDCAHAPQEEKPLEVNLALLGFLDRP